MFRSAGVAKYVFIAVFNSNIDEIVESLKRNLSAPDEYFPMVVWREKMLESTLGRLGKASFDPAKRLNVNILCNPK